jgi:hypothetical protein
MFEAVIPFSAFLAIPQIPPVTSAITSIMYSTSLKIEVYKKLAVDFSNVTPDSQI